MRLDNYLRRELRDVPKSHIYRIIRSGEVRVNRGRARPSVRVAAGDEVRIPPVHSAPVAAPGRPPDTLIDRIGAAVVGENDDWLLLDKPPGIAVHAGSGVRFGVIEVLRAARPGDWLELVHRLDRGTSGCLLLAKNRAALNRLRLAWRQRQVVKQYLALLDGVWHGGELQVDAPLRRDCLQGAERMTKVVADGKSAASVFTPMERFAIASLQAVTITTGRTHQIRVHAAYSGHPLAGDDKYGLPGAVQRWRALGLRRLFLHAWRLQLPASGEYWESPLPAELDRVLARLRDTTTT